MKLSIVVPTRLRDQTLARCLESLRLQVATVAAEVIVTDDGTTDSTREMIESRFSFARWIRGPQRGPAANRNHGAFQAGGDFILFLDDDVVPSSTVLSAYVAAIRPGVNVYEGRTTCQDGLRSPLEHSPVNETGGWLWSCNLMLRQTLWKSLGGFDEAFPYPHLEDVAFRDRLQAANERVVFVPDAIVDHPPRRVPAAKILAMYQESYFLYHYRYLGRAPSVRKFVGTLVSHRIQSVLSRELSRDSAIALSSMCIEAFYVLKNWHTWDKKWSKTLRAAISHKSESIG